LLVVYVFDFIYRLMTDRFIFTYQTRLVLNESQAASLDAYAALYGKVERSLFAAKRAGGEINELKRSFCKRFGITARQFNAVRVGLDGTIDSINARRPELIAELESRIKTATKVVAKLALRPSQAGKLHQKRRRLAILQSKLDSMKSDHENGIVRIAFGSKKLFNAQFSLQANRFESHDLWKEAWSESRSNQFFVLGSKDEVAGNQTCQAALCDDGSLSLMLRLPDSLVEAEEPKQLKLSGVRFTTGQPAILAALGSSKREMGKTKAGKDVVRYTGSAMSYRFLRDETGWRVFVSCETQPIKQRTNTKLGAIGVDINADHLAVSEIDRFGNLVEVKRIDLNTYGKSTEQVKALIGDVAVDVVGMASKAGKPLVLEKLDFARKKAELEVIYERQSRMLSSFACNKVISSIKACAFRSGVGVIEVNPAFTSVIGSVNYAQVKGISVHMGAAVAIARRGLGLSERCPVGDATVPTRNGGHVAFLVPARNPKKHVWAHWGKVKSTLKAAHVAHYRRVGHKKSPPPLHHASDSLGAIRSSAVQSRSANRQDHCSPGVSPNHHAEICSVVDRFE
jgi:IS605 OrfB family transposase